MQFAPSVGRECMWSFFHTCPCKASNDVQTAGSIWDQYPLLCPVVSEIAKGLPAKVTIHKGFLRTGAGHHHIVDPALAKAYFSETCLGPSCELVMKTYKQRSSTDVFDKTPYFRPVSQLPTNCCLTCYDQVLWLCWRHGRASYVITFNTSYIYNILPTWQMSLPVPGSSISLVRLQNWACLAKRIPGCLLLPFMSRCWWKLEQIWNVLQILLSIGQLNTSWQPHCA